MRREDDEDPDVPWIPDEALAALTAEAEVLNEKPEDQARRLLRENLPMAIIGIVHTASHGSSDRIRLEAQKYITERVLGRVGDDAFGDTQSPVESFIEDVTEYVAGKSGS